MRTKDEILNDLQTHVDKLDPQHQELAKVAMIETEIQIDIRDILQYHLLRIGDLYSAFKEKD